MKAIALAAIAVVAGSAFAQSTPTPSTTEQQVIQRQVNQQQRVENGLKDGSLTQREAGRIERKESQLDREIARDAKGGISAQEQARINRRENAISQDIEAARNNNARGNPANPGNQRLQADVQRNINQDQRIENGVKTGQLTNREVAGLERGQARVDAKEARATRNGNVGAGEQRRIQRTENRQSRYIRNQKHDG